MEFSKQIQFSTRPEKNERMEITICAILLVVTIAGALVSFSTGFGVKPLADAITFIFGITLLDGVAGYILQKTGVIKREGLSKRANYLRSTIGLIVIAFSVYYFGLVTTLTAVTGLFVILFGVVNSLVTFAGAFALAFILFNAAVVIASMFSLMFGLMTAFLVFTVAMIILIALNLAAGYLFGSEKSSRTNCSDKVTKNTRSELLDHSPTTEQ